jgi:actin-related protein
MQDGETQVGNDITNVEAVRFQLKTQFDRNVVTHFEAQEQVFDYMFTRLGIDTEGHVNHPIVMTEAFLNPNYSRHCKLFYVVYLTSLQETGMCGNLFLAWVLQPEM